MTLREWIDGLGQVEVAKKLKVKRQHVHNWRRRSNLPRPATMVKIVKLTKGKVTYREMLEDYVNFDKTR